jgi:hypothetical protein
MPENNLSNFALTEFYYVSHLAQLHCTQGTIFGTLNAAHQSQH